MVNITINNKKISVKENSTILEVCDENNIHIPRLCYLKEINEVNACRVCLVEIEGVNELVPSCTTKVKEGMVIFTHSKKALDSRRNQVRFLLSNHKYNCAVCAKNASCVLRKAAEDLDIISMPFNNEYEENSWDNKLPLIRDNSKCIKCGRCVNVCEKIQGLNVWDFNNKGNKISINVKDGKNFNEVDCSFCGQCIVNCPTNALSSRDDIDKFIDAVGDKEKVVVVQVAPAVRTAWAESLSINKEDFTVEKMVSCIKALGVDYVFDTNFSADLTIMEEGTELFEHLKTRKNKLPMFTSCCPGWVRFMKMKHPELVHNLSTSKSPQQMFGAVCKTYFAKKMGIDPKNIYCVSIMPCVAKKYECDVKEVNHSADFKDVDLSLTTRELAKLIKMYGIDIHYLGGTQYDSPLGTGTGAAVIFGSTGGVMEAALRTAYYLTYGKNPGADDFKVVRGEDGIRYAEVDLNGTKVKAAVAHGLANAEKLINDIKNNKVELDFVEVMTCPGGCINGGGQPEKSYEKIVEERRNYIYDLDKNANIRFSHENPEIDNIYKNFLGKPLGELSEELLHTDQSKWSL